MQGVFTALLDVLLSYFLAFCFASFIVKQKWFFYIRGSNCILLPSPEVKNCLKIGVDNHMGGGDTLNIIFEMPAE